MTHSLCVCLQEIFSYLMRDKLTLTNLFYSYVSLVGMFDIYINFYLPIKWIFSSRRNYPELWMGQPISAQTNFHVSQAIFEPRRLPANEEIIEIESDENKSESRNYLSISNRFYRIVGIELPAIEI